MVKIRTLLNLLTYAACLLGVAPLFPHLELGARIGFPLALVAGILFDRRQRYPFKTATVTVLSVALFALYATRISLDDLVGPVVNILTLLLAVRLLTEKTGRNYLQIFVLTIFALAGSSLLSLSSAFFVYLVLLVTCVTVGLVLLPFHAIDSRLRLPRRKARTLLSVAGLLPAGSLLLMLVFFFILPRTQHPLWNFLNPAATATAGFTEEVAPGSVAGIAAVKALAFRAESPQLPPDQLYWRGIVLNKVEGGTWVRATPPAAEAGRVSGGRSVQQTIYPEPKQGRYLFALDLPLNLSGIRARRSADLVHTARRSGSRRKYQAVSLVGGRLEATAAPDLDFYLQVPGPLTGRLRDAAGQIAAGEPTDREKVARVEAFFRAQQLVYATDDLPGSTDPVDEFLFLKKRGYCEFFASSFATLLRLSGVPARLVGGYYGGKYNEMGGYYLVTEDTAHVWVEALIDGRQWIRVDPSRLAQNAAAALVEPRAQRLVLGRRLLDAVNYHWNRAVITYDLGRQLQLLRRVNVQARQLRISFDFGTALRYLLIPAVALAALAGLIRRLRSSREERILRTFLRRVQKKHRLGRIPETVGLEALAKRVDDPLCREFAEIYGRALYRDRKLTAEELQRLRDLVRGLKRGR